VAVTEFGNGRVGSVSFPLESSVGGARRTARLKGETWVDVHERLAQLRSMVENARAMPMSASAVVNRPELLAEIDALASELANAFTEADRVIAERDAVIAEGRVEAERIITEGGYERDRLASDTEVYRVAKIEADKMREEAQKEAVELRQETDEYVDSRLANFEVALGKTMEAVARGRQRLHGRSDLDRWGREGVDDILLPGEEEP
jgi:cell division septum initiation protein DivIVA